MIYYLDIKKHVTSFKDFLGERAVIIAMKNRTLSHLVKFSYYLLWHKLL